MRLYYLAASCQATGRLELRDGSVRFALSIKRGTVEHASSDAPEHDLGAYLVGRGVVSSEQVADASRVQGEFGGDLVASLIALRLVNPAESFRVLQEHGLAVIARALALGRGSWTWDPGAAAPGSAFPLGSRWGLLCDAARRLDVLAVRGRLGERARRAARRVGSRIQISELGLTAIEARAAALFDGRASPAQLAAARPSEAETILRVANLLAETELLAFGEAVADPALPAGSPTAAATPKPAAAPSAGNGTPASPPTHRRALDRGAPTDAPTPDAPTPDAPTPDAPTPSSRTATPPARPTTPTPVPARTSTPTPVRAAKPPARPPSTPNPRTDPASLAAEYQRLLDADHFEALGVKREAAGAQIKAAYLRLAKVYHPDAAEPGESPETRKLREDIFARLGEAWATLGDDAKRAEYARLLASGGAQSAVDVSAIFQAEELFQRATVFVKTRQYPKALDALEQAMKLNAEEPEFDVWRAWIEFLVAADRTKQHAASAARIEAALKKSPRCMPGYLFLGQMAKLDGDPGAAERHLKRGLALDPGHADLARELRHLGR
jgi:curved DNA-binding protein CbpA